MGPPARFFPAQPATRNPQGVVAKPASGAGVEYAKCAGPWRRTPRPRTVSGQSADSPRTPLPRYLTSLAAQDEPAFICHFYNVYFAHTAGGRMIGKKVSDMILDGKALDFYQWAGSLEQSMAAVKESLNAVAEGWSREQKDRCLAETELSFKYSGALLRIVAGG